MYMQSKSSGKIHSEFIAVVTSRTGNRFVGNVMVLEILSWILPLGFHSGCSFCFGTLFLGLFSWLTAFLSGLCSVVPSSLEIFPDPFV